MPTMYLTPTADTFIYQGRPKKNYARSTSMFAGRDESGYLGMSLLNFPISSALPAGAVVTRAELRLHVLHTERHALSQVYGVYRILQRWSATTATWRKQPTFEALPVSTFAQPEHGPLVIDITGAVQTWVLGSAAPLGVMIGPYSDFPYAAFFRASAANAINSDFWPRVKLTYSVLTVIAGSLTPQFTDEKHVFTVPSLDNTYHDKDVSLLSPISIWATNNGPGSVELRLFTSPDGSNFAPDGPVIPLFANETTSLVAAVFSRFVRTTITSVDIRPATITLHYQGHIG